MKENKSSEKSSFLKKSLTSCYRILVRINRGMYAAQIGRQLKLTKQSMSYYTNKLEKLGYIKKEFRSNYKQYKLTAEGLDLLKQIRSTKLSLSVKDKNIRMHNLAIKFPILEDNPEAKFERETKINNWIKSIDVLTFPIGITIEKTTKNVIAYFHRFQTSKIKFLTDFYSWINKGIYYVYYYLMKEKQIKIDIFNAEIIREHIANESPELNKKIDKKKTVEIGLDRTARGIYPSKIPAKAWIDRSFGNVDLETNDLIYEEKLLLMPEIVHNLDKNLVPAINDLTKQVNLHLEIQKQMLIAMKKLNKNLDKSGGKGNENQKKKG